MGAAVRITHSTMEDLANVTQMQIVQVVPNCPMEALVEAPVALPVGGVEIGMPIAHVLDVKTSQAQAANANFMTSVRKTWFKKNPPKNSAP